MNKNWILGLPVLSLLQELLLSKNSFRPVRAPMLVPVHSQTVPKNEQIGIITEPLGSGRPCWETLDPASDIPPVAVTS